MKPAPRHLRASGWTSELIARVRAIDPHAVDALVAVALTAAALATAASRVGDDNEFRSVDLPGIALVLLQTMPLAALRVAPLGVIVVISAAIVAHSGMGYEMVEAGTFSSLVALYGAASLVDSRRAVLALFIAAAAIGGFYALNREDFGWLDVTATGTTWALGWLIGRFVRARGEQAEAASAHAALLERDQEMRARAAVADERARMARELHDIVGHALNIIVIQAAGAQRVLESRPQVASDSLTAIESAGREALSDMERMLGVLRESEVISRELGPQPGLLQVDGLATQVSEAGLPVEVTVQGRPLDLPASVELSAYRIVQEALTNALKHSGGSRARVTIRYEPDSLELEITDDGHGSLQRMSGAAGAGRGLIGMRERVAIFGGELSAGPMAEGGYRVHARLPLKGVAA
jgi:signal transduction histidine kinase